MNYINEKEKQIPVHAECDVLVVGSGPAGLSAAIAAAREGVKVDVYKRQSLGWGIGSSIISICFGWLIRIVFIWFLPVQHV